MNKVLVATDFSAQFALLPEYIEDLGYAGVKDVVLVHVLEDEDGDSSDSEEGRTAFEKLENLKCCLEEKGFTAKVFLRWGKPAVEIEATAINEEVDFIVLISQKNSYFKRVFLGSTSLELAKIACSPVLIENGQLKKADDKKSSHFRKVLFPTTFSLQSLVGLKMVRAMNSYIEEVVFVHVIDDKNDACDIEEQATAALEELVEELSDFGVKSTYNILRGNPAQKIIEFIDVIDASMVVLPKIDGSLMKNLLLGGTAQNIAVTVEIPVMIFPVECPND